MSVPPVGKLFGFNTNLWNVGSGPDLVPFEVDRSAQAGAQVIRTTLDWSSFASSPDKPLGNEGAYHPERGTLSTNSGLGRLDELYDRAAAAGVRLDLIVSNAPLWASAYARCKPRFGRYPPGCSPVAKHKRLYPTAAHLVDLANFVGALGRRYPGAIFETWNEPNLDQGPQAVGGAFIGRMQCAVYAAAKGLATPSPVLSAAFGDFYGEDATRAYMRDFYSTGDSCFDALSVHTYNGSNHSFGAGSPLAGHMKIYRDARAEAGDTRPIWVTEFGFSTWRGDAGVSERDQATLIRQEYNKLLTMPDVQAAFAHTLRDPKPRGLIVKSQPDGAFGWLRDDSSPKPVYCDFTRLAGHPACG